MSTTKLKIANIAIFDVGGNKLAAIPDGNKVESEAIETYWDQAFEEVLAAHPWKNFKKWMSLTTAGEITYDGDQLVFEEETLVFEDYGFIDEQYTYAFYLPEDFVRWVDVEYRTVEFARRGLYLLSNEEELEIEYIHKPAIAAYDTVLRWDPWFNAALAANLSFKIEPKLRRKGSEKVDWENRFYNTLAIAQKLDSGQDKQSAERQIRHTTDTDTWLQGMG